MQREKNVVNYLKGEEKWGWGGGGRVEMKKVGGLENYDILGYVH